MIDFSNCKIKRTKIYDGFKAYRISHNKKEFYKKILKARKEKILDVTS